MAQFLSKPFGMTPNGEKINEYIISNPGGLAVSVLNYGCIIKNIWVPTKRGPVDVVLGHDTYADYVKDFESSGSTCCGAFVGRYANRIENAVFNVGGKTYQLEANNAASWGYISSHRYSSARNINSFPLTKRVSNISIVPSSLSVFTNLISTS